MRRRLSAQARWRLAASEGRRGPGSAQSARSMSTSPREAVGEASGDASQIGAGVTQAGAPTAPGWTEASDELKDLHPTGLEEHLWPAMPRPGARWLANYHQAEQQRALLPESTP